MEKLSKTTSRKSKVESVSNQKRSNQEVPGEQHLACCILTREKIQKLEFFFSSHTLRTCRDMGKSPTAKYIY